MALALCGCAGPPVESADTRAAASIAEVRTGLPPCEATGAAVHLGGGIFVTAAHVVDGTPARLRGCAPARARSVISFQGKAGLAQLIGAGTAEVAPVIGLRYLGGRDIGLLRLADSSGPAAHLCRFDPLADETVIVASPRRVFRTHVLGTMREDIGIYGGYAEIAVRMEPGESGAGVFDAARACLLGVVSHRDAPSPERTRIVLTSALRAFLAEEQARLPAAIAGVAVQPRRW